MFNIPLKNLLKLTSSMQCKIRVTQIINKTINKKREMNLSKQICINSFGKNYSS